jgi:hypothetical protein
MNVNNLYGSPGSSPLTNVGSAGAVGTSTPGVSSIPPAMGGAATAQISTPGQFLSDMQQLSQQNPAEFKAVAAQVATSFQNAASQTSGPQAQVLNNLANQFSQAAQTGSLQAPQGTQAGQAAQAPQGLQGVAASQGSGGAGVHHHHHHHGGGGSATQSSVIQQAFQGAMTILNQATQGTSTSTST